MIVDYIIPITISEWSTDVKDAVKRIRGFTRYLKSKKRKNAIVEYLDYQIPVTQLKGQRENGDMQATKRDGNGPPTRGLNIWLCGR